MKKRLIIEIDLTSSSGRPYALEDRMKYLVSVFKSEAASLACDPDHQVVHNDWDDPHACELSITVEELP